MNEVLINLPPILPYDFNTPGTVLMNIADAVGTTAKAVNTIPERQGVFAGMVGAASVVSMASSTIYNRGMRSTGVGTNGAIRIEPNTDLELTPYQDFTLECFLAKASATQNPGNGPLFNFGLIPTTSQTYFYYVRTSNVGVFRVGLPDGSLLGESVPTFNLEGNLSTTQFKHLLLQSKANQLEAYFEGKKIWYAPVPSGLQQINTQLIVGNTATLNNATNKQFIFNGIRFTQGYARVNSEFTAPKTAFVS